MPRQRAARAENNRNDSSVQQMIELLRSGDSDVWEVFIERYRRLIYSAIHRANARFGAEWDEQTMEEIFEEVLFRLLRRGGQALASWRGRCRLETWIYRIARNICIDRLRKDGRRAAHEEALPPTGARSEDGAARRDLRISLEQAIAHALVSQEAIAVRLIYFEGYTYREAAERLGMTTGAMSGLVYRALRKLRDEVGVGVAGESEVTTG